MGTPEVEKGAKVRYDDFPLARMPYSPLENHNSTENSKPLGK